MTSYWTFDIPFITIFQTGSGCKQHFFYIFSWWAAFKILIYSVWKMIDCRQFFSVERGEFTRWLVEIIFHRNGLEVLDVKHFNFKSCNFCFTNFWYWSILQQDIFTAFLDRLPYICCHGNACGHFEFRRHWFCELMWKLNHCRQNSSTVHRTRIIVCEKLN